MVVVWKTNTGSQLLSAVVHELHWMAIVGTVTTSALDLVIALAICFQLYRARTGFAKSEKIIQLITLYIVSSGLLTMSLNMSVLISFLAAPTTLLFQLFNMSVSKAYANAFLATLNSRQSIRGRATDTFASYSIPPIVFRTGNDTGSEGLSEGTGNNRGKEGVNIALENFTTVHGQDSVADVSKAYHESMLHDEA